MTVCTVDMTCSIHIAYHAPVGNAEFIDANQQETNSGCEASKRVSVPDGVTNACTFNMACHWCAA